MISSAGFIGTCNFAYFLAGAPERKQRRALRGPCSEALEHKGRSSVRLIGAIVALLRSLFFTCAKDFTTFVRELKNYAT